jgi:predicted CoA-binding protein
LLLALLKTLTVIATKQGIETHALGLREGKVFDVLIQTHAKDFRDVDTVSLYVGPANQEHWLPSILELRPRRVIFNPGTENPMIEEILKSSGIEVTHACTLVLLSTQQY